MDSTKVKIEKIKLEKIKIEKIGTKKNRGKFEREKYEIKIEVLNDLEMKEESETEYIDQLKRETRCLMRANTSAESGTKIWKKKYKDMELESKVKMLREAVNYEKGLEAFRLNNGELSALVEEKRMECACLEDKLNGLNSMKDVVDNELKGVRTECSELKKLVTELEDGHKVMHEREKKQQEQILYLLNVKDKCEQLERMNKELEVEKNRLEEELKKKNGELDEEKRRNCNGLEGILSEWSLMKDVAERKNGELELEKNKLKEELNDSMAECNALRDQNSLISEREKVALDKITELYEEIWNLRREMRDLTDGGNSDSSEKDVSDSDEENNSRNEIEEMQTGIENEREEIISESRSRSAEIVNETREKNEESTSDRSSKSEEIQHEAAVDLDDEALPDVGGDYSIPIDIESDSLIVISDSEDSSGSCKKERTLGSTPKRKWVEEEGTSGIKTEDEYKMKKLGAGKNVFLERFSMEMQNPTKSKY